MMLGLINDVFIYEVFLLVYKLVIVFIDIVLIYKGIKVLFELYFEC